MKLAMLALLFAAFSPFYAQAAEQQPQLQVYTTDDARDGAELRSNVYIVVSMLYDPCPKSDVITPAVQRYEALRNSQTAHARKVDFALPHADYDYQMSLVDIACHELTDEEQRRMDEIEARVANSTMDRIEEILSKLAERGE